MKRITFASNIKENMVPMGWFIRAIRTALKMTQNEFATVIGVASYVEVSRWETGRHKPDPRACRKINDVYSRLSSRQHDELWANALLRMEGRRQCKP